MRKNVLTTVVETRFKLECSGTDPSVSADPRLKLDQTLVTTENISIKKPLG